MTSPGLHDRHFPETPAAHEGSELPPEFPGDESEIVSESIQKMLFKVPATRPTPPVAACPPASQPVVAEQGIPAELKMPPSGATVPEQETVDFVMIDERESVLETSAENTAKAGKSKKTRSTTLAVLPFAEFGLREEVREAVERSGYTQPTPIQSGIIPQMMAGRDILAQSETGSGKTAAFALPILSQIDSVSRKTQILVLTPTRELAIQVAKSFTTYGTGLPAVNVLPIYGGQDYEIQFRQLKRGAHIVVGTPGRVIDHINRGTLDLRHIRCLVLDEADEMLNMGFLEDVQLVLEKIPATRQIALFSATLPQPICEIADAYLNNPAKITIRGKTMTAESIRQRAVLVSPRDKMEVLLRILEVEETHGVIVFTKTKDATINVADQLIRAGKSAIALNGDMPQKVRERAIDQLKAGHLDILVATDVAARGLDVPRVSHVFNFDLPHDSQSYVHRIGRTGRAGRSGEAIIFLPASSRGKLRPIERLTRQPIEIVDPPSVSAVNAVRVKKFQQQITETIASTDLAFLETLIGDYMAQSGLPAVTIAAALATMGQRGRKFLMEDRSLLTRGDRKKAGGQEEHAERGKGERGQGGIRRGGPPRPGMTRYRIEVGWRDGVKPGNIVGAVANEANLDGQDIGDINIRNAFSTIDLPENLSSESIEKLQRTCVSGRQLRLRPDTPPGQRSSPDQTAGPGRPFRSRTVKAAAAAPVPGPRRPVAGKRGTGKPKKKYRTRDQGSS